MSFCFGELPELHATLEAAYEPSVVGMSSDMLVGTFEPARVMVANAQASASAMGNTAPPNRR